MTAVIKPIQFIESLSVLNITYTLRNDPKVSQDYGILLYDDDESNAPMVQNSFNEM